ncbi:MAG: peptigoglycan-binding protein LysM, partial [Pseudomonadales bacterium]|nr:peptigoglycan-binding protein LysM [Pseudomonadales bacterium]
MRKPFSYMAAGLVVMGQAGTAAALGLGEIELQSALNQPLSANIRLLQADGLASDEILITLATPAEFERAGIDRPALLSELRFVIATDAEGRRVIRVSSREPMREPYLDFLLEVQWPQGKMMREFTLLLDPPGYVMKQPVTPPAVRTAPVVMPAASAPAAAPTPRPTPSEPAPASEG